jgi:hypothetical protein
VRTGRFSGAGAIKRGIIWIDQHCIQHQSHHIRWEWTVRYKYICAQWLCHRNDHWHHLERLGCCAKLRLRVTWNDLQFIHVVRVLAVGMGDVLDGLVSGTSYITLDHIWLVLWMFQTNLQSLAQVSWGGSRTESRAIVNEAKTLNTVLGRVNNVPFVILFCCILDVKRQMLRSSCSSESNESTRIALASVMDIGCMSDLCDGDQPLRWLARWHWTLQSAFLLVSHTWYNVFHRPDQEPSKVTPCPSLALAYIRTTQPRHLC